MTEMALQMSGLGAGDRLLDIGCGKGASAALISSRDGLHVTGFDRSLAALLEAHASVARVYFSQAVAERLPLARHSYDAVLVECALCFLDLGMALQEFQRVLKPGGKLLLNDILLIQEDQSARQTLAANSCLGNFLGRDTLLAVLGEHAFEILNWEEYPQVIKQWLGEMIFRFGSRAQFYRRLMHNPAADVTSFMTDLKKIKLIACLVIAEKKE